MSIAYLGWAFGTEEPRLGTRLVLFVLGDMAQDHTFPVSEDDEGAVWPGVCWPSVKTIGRHAQISRAGCFEALAALEKMGLVRTIPAEQHELAIMGRKVRTPIRQLAGPNGFKRLPCESSDPVQILDSEGGPESGRVQNPGRGGVQGLDPNRNKEPSKEEANASPSKARGLNEVYGKPETPGSAAAPWLVLELARLMRQNDEKVRLPAGVKKAVVAWEKAQGHEHASPSLAMRVLEADGWHSSLKPWLDAARLLVDTDGRPAREAAQVLRFSQTDPFWKVNVLSMPKFREKYSQVRGKALGASRQLAASAERGPTTRAQLDLIVERNRVRDDDDA